MPAADLARLKNAVDDVTKSRMMHLGVIYGLISLGAAILICLAIIVIVVIVRRRRSGEATVSNKYWRIFLTSVGLFHFVVYAYLMFKLAPLSFIAKIHSDLSNSELDRLFVHTNKLNRSRPMHNCKIITVVSKKKELFVIGLL